MAQSVELQISGQITASVRVNVRQGAPSISSPVLRKLNPGAVLDVTAVVVGDQVQGNPHWYRIDDGSYVWAGAFSQLMTSAPDLEVNPSAAAGNSELDGVPLVVDMYHGDGYLSFADARVAGLVGIIHKATTGATGIDDAYSDRRQVAKAAGLLWGAFHWGTAAPIADQVKNFLDAADPDDATLVALDFERDDGNQMTLDGAREFLAQLNAKLGRKAVLYSGDTAKSALGNQRESFFGSHRLWLAQYGNLPSVQRSWDKFWLWQYTDGSLGPGRKSVPGITGDRLGRLDCNYFAGSPQELAAQWAS